MDEGWKDTGCIYLYIVMNEWWHNLLSLDPLSSQKIPVYRLAEAKIGCSLAESAEKIAYSAWLAKAASVPNSLHVVYINTSLVTKAQSHEIIPTITCTSSNVLQTILQSFAQIPDLNIW